MKFILVLAGVLVYRILPAQYLYYNDRYYETLLLPEIGTGIGGINALTDLGGRKGPGRGFLKDFTPATIRPSLQFAAAITYRYAIGLRLEYTRGCLTGYDSLLKNGARDNPRYIRNLSFRSPLSELSLLVEIHPLVIFSGLGKNPRLSPYLAGGIGYFRFNPQAELEGGWVDLQPLRLEGQGFPEYPDRNTYSLGQFCSLLGGGWRFEASPRLYLRLEIIYRKLSTDYLDDVSRSYIDPALFDRYLDPDAARIARQLYDRRGIIDPGRAATPDIRGNPENKDAYFTMMLKLGFTFRKRR